MSLLRQLVEPVGMVEESVKRAPVVETRAPQEKQLEPLHETDGEVRVMHYDPRIRTGENTLAMIDWMYRQVEGDGLLDLYFPKITKEDARANRQMMFANLVASGNYFIVVKVATEAGQKNAYGEVANAPGDWLDFVGFATCATIPFGLSTVGLAGFVFLKRHWDRHTTAQAAKRLMGLWFAGIRNTNPDWQVENESEWIREPMTTLVGQIAEDNKLANRFVSSLGWTRMTPSIPMNHFYDGHPSATVQWFITAEQFLAQGGAE